MNDTLTQIKNRQAKIGVIGLGYVGLPLAVAFAKRNFPVIGIDVDVKKTTAIQKGVSYIQDIPSTELKALVQSGHLAATHDFSSLKQAQVIIICVPTPLRKSREPDLSFVLRAIEAVQNNLQKGQLIILESTTYPGTTQELILPLLTKNGFKVGEDFGLAFSPERIDPGNQKYQIANTPKVVGGVTTNCLELATSLYQHIVKQVVPVSSPIVAELVKLLENTFRAVNIALVNEMAIICNKLGVETGEVIQAAATKPFGFIPFWPGPGLGGHCIPIDPHYLSWKLKTLKYHPRFIQLADEINTEMPSYVVSRVVACLNAKGLSVKGAKILILGVSYKKDVGDLRESPALDVFEELLTMGANVSYHDPFFPEIQIDGRRLTSQPPQYAQNDCVLILTDHSCFHYPTIVQESRLVFDARNVTVGIQVDREKVFRL